jgi:copper(I)-binding protein
MKIKHVVRPKSAPGGRGPEWLRPILAWSVLALCVAPLAARAARGATPLAISGPWIRTVGGATPAAAYFTLSNASDRSVVLVDFSSPECGQLMMHQSRTINGVSSMTMVAQRIVPAHGQIIFSPGGYHLMCLSPSKAVRAGARIPITLRFADGQQLMVRFPVRPLGG